MKFHMIINYSIITNVLYSVKTKYKYMLMKVNSKHALTKQIVANQYKYSSIHTILFINLMVQINVLFNAKKK